MVGGSAAMSDKGVLNSSAARARAAGGAVPPLRSVDAAIGIAGKRAIPVPSWQRARDLSCSALLAGEMCVVVTGLPGTGKSVLVDTVARVLRSTGWTVVTSAARLPSTEELAELSGSAAILIDDADRLSAAELRTLNRSRQCSVLLAGAVGFEKRCPADSRVTLLPLSAEEVGSYAELWLEQAGLDPALMTDEAVAHLGDVSAGIPRVLGILLTDAVKAARAERSERIDEHHVDVAAWRHVEHTAARRINRAAAATPVPPGKVEPAPLRPDVALEMRLSQAPFADAPRADRASGSTRTVGLIGVGVVLAMGIAGGVMLSPRWLPRLAAAYSSFAGAAPVEAPAAAAAPAPQPSPQPPREAAVLPALPLVAEPPAPAAASAAPPEPVVAVAPPPAAPQRDEPAAEPLSPEMVRLLVQRGQQMVELNDFSAARLLFARAADAGSVRAMLALGRSYDPLVLGSVGGLAGVDPVQAARWYRRAALLGSADADILLQQLERGARE